MLHRDSRYWVNWRDATKKNVWVTPNSGQVTGFDIYVAISGLGPNPDSLNRIGEVITAITRCKEQQIEGHNPVTANVQAQGPGSVKYEYGFGGDITLNLPTTPLTWPDSHELEVAVKCIMARILEDMKGGYTTDPLPTP